MEASDIFKTSILVSCRNINFIISTSIVSLPLLCFLVYYESSFQKFLLETFEILKESLSFDTSPELKNDYLHQLIQMGFLYIVPYHLLQFSTVLLTVDLASNMYKEDKPMSLRHMLSKRKINTERLGGTVITFFNFHFVTFLSICILLGFIWFVKITGALESSLIDVSSSFFPTALHGGAILVVLILYLTLSVVWNMSIVVYILEGVYGTKALVLSCYYLGEKGECGIILMLVFLFLETGLRFLWLNVGWCKGVYGILAQSSLFCLENVLKWVVFVVYYHNCKERAIVKNVDLEIGIEVKPVGEVQGN